MQVSTADTADKRCALCQNSIEVESLDQTRIGVSAASTHASCLGARARQVCEDLCQKPDFESFFLALTLPENLLQQNDQQRLYILGLLVEDAKNAPNPFDEHKSLYKLIGNTNVLDNLTSSALRTRLQELIDAEPPNQLILPAALASTPLGLTTHSSSKHELDLSPDQASAVVEAWFNELEKSQVDAGDSSI